MSLLTSVRGNRHWLLLCHNLRLVKTQSMPLLQAELNLVFSILQHLDNMFEGAVVLYWKPRCFSCLLSIYLLYLFTYWAFGLCCVLADLWVCVCLLVFFFFVFSFGFVCVCLVVSKGPISSTASTTTSPPSSPTSRPAGAGASQSPAYQATHSLALPLAQGEPGPPLPSPPTFLPSFPCFTSSLHLPVWPSMLHQRIVFEPVLNTDFITNVNLLFHIAASVVFCCYSKDGAWCRHGCNGCTITPSGCFSPRCLHSQTGASGRKSCCRPHQVRSCMSFITWVVSCCIGKWCPLKLDLPSFLLVFVPQHWTHRDHDATAHGGGEKVPPYCAP